MIFKNEITSMQRHFFFLKANVEKMYIDTNSRIILINRKFFKAQTFDIFIRKIISLIIVNKLKNIKHRTNEYVVALIYFLDVNAKNKTLIIIKITREVHLINDLKANMFIENDFIDVANKKIHIASCDVNIFIYLKIFKKIVHERVHALKFLDVSSMSKMIIVVHNNVIIFLDKNFFFELNELNLSIYAYIVNSKTREILIRNEFEKTIHILKNCRLDRIIKFNFFNIF